MTGVRNPHSPPWREGAEAEALHSPCFDVDLAKRVIPMPSDIAAELARKGLVGIEPTPASVRLLGDAVSWIKRVPELASILHAVVGEIHLLEAESGYDVSHSEPRWRSSIFVSVPDRMDEIGALRLAESIVHEAMHLHLTNREQHQCLVAPGDGTMLSPWREDLRPRQGVMHGLFVFSCLSSFFRSLTTGAALDTDGRAHVEQRLHEIDKDVRSIDFATLVDGLTELGIALVAHCRSVAAKGSVATLRDNVPNQRVLPEASRTII